MLLTDVERHYASQTMAHSTGSTECWDTALRWLNDCRSNHPECLVPDEPSWYPTRLLDIGTGVDDVVRVVISAETQPKDGYVTLSHRWGDVMTTKLTKASFQDLKSGIALQQLPLTFQHATEIAKRLDKRYIWIDSLCIFQDNDDKSDWLKEAALMDKVYSNSFLNISATAGYDNSQGLFVTRDPEFELRPTRISCPIVPTSSTQASQIHNFIVSDVLLFERELMNAPLNRRAWVLQERLMAPRVLHFGSAQLFWECRRGLLCERFPETFPDFMNRLTATTFKSMDISKRRPNKRGKRHISEVPQGKNSDLIVVHLWTTVVAAYSGCQLTFGSDKAIALSGIAKVMRDVFQDEYVAGLWRRCLEAQLLWHVNDARQADYRPSTRSFAYRAPTWSWLSVDGDIHPGRCLRDGLHIEVLDVAMKYRSEDTTGLITDGSLTLRGRLRPLKLRVFSFTLDDGRHIEMPGIWTATVSGKDLLSSADGLKPWERIGVITYLDVPQADFNDSNDRNELFIMSAGGPWVTVDDPFINGDVDPFHSMLLLKCVDRDKGVFHRFGIASLNIRDKPDLWELVQEYDADEADMPCVEYDAERHLHTIIFK